MNDRGPRTPNDEVPAEGSPRAQGRRTENETRSRALLVDTTGGVAYEICGVTLQLGHRAVRFSCGQGRHVLHVRGVVETLARGHGTSTTPLSSGRLRNPASRTGRNGGSGPSRPGSSQSGGEYGSGNQLVARTSAAGGFVTDGTTPAWA